VAVPIGWFTQWAGGELFGEGTHVDGQQVSFAPSRHTGFTLVDQF